MTVRKWYVGQALKSMAGLIETLPELTEEEVLACLDLESQTERRESVLSRLTSRAVRLNEIRYVKELNLKYRSFPSTK
jgi:hypothetical protein